jgi:hypothetical protein
MEVVRDTGQTQMLPLQRCDVEDPGTGIFSERYWSVVSVPVLGGSRAKPSARWIRRTLGRD